MFKNKFAGMAITAATAAALVLTATACSSKQEQTTTEASQTQAAKTLTEEEAKAAALKHAKVNEKDANFTKVSLNSDDGKQVYDLEFTAGDTEYEYEIDATTGDITSYGQVTVKVEKDSGSKSTEQTQTKKTESTSTDQSNYISEDEALNKAIEHAGIATTDVTYSEVELDLDDMTPHYDIEFHDVQNYEYSYEIDATNGNVLNYDMPEIDD